MCDYNKRMRPNVPRRVSTTTVNPYKFGTFDQYLSYCALGGLITSDEGNISRMSVSQFCQQFGVDRKTTYRWRLTPGFDDKVRARREEIFPLARETAAWNRLFLIGLQTDDMRAAVEALKLFLGHFGGLQLPEKRQSQPNPNNLAEKEYDEASNG